MAPKANENIKEAAPKMKENMTYSIVKGAVVNLTRLMSSYYGKYNIKTI